MIITVKKDFKSIKKQLEYYKKIFIIGCAACATKCQTGSEEAVKEISELLKCEGKEVTGYAILDTPCDVRIVKKDILKNAPAGTSDAVLVLACGAGVQAVGSVFDKKLIPGLDPVFVGTTERIGLYHEYCVLCGECIISETESICPVSRCAKGFVNGPCGGMVDGKCEIDNTRDCAWVLIFEKLKAKGKNLESLKKYTPPRDKSIIKKIDITKKPK